MWAVILVVLTSLFLLKKVFENDLSESGLKEKSLGRMFYMPPYFDYAYYAVLAIFLLFVLAVGLKEL